MADRSDRGKGRRGRPQGTGQRRQDGSNQRRLDGSNQRRQDGNQRRQGAAQRDRREPSRRAGAAQQTVGSASGAVQAPAIPDDVQADELDPAIRRDLVSLPKELADRVARHLVAAGLLLDDEPERALEHARFARTKASRIAAVREAAGLAAYRAGEWAEALAELRAARRISGGPGHLPIMADVERALGRPERALELARSPEAGQLGPADRIELLIVAAGARRDLGQTDAAVAALEVDELDPRRDQPWSARLFYAYADNLLAAGRREDAIRWFLAAADADHDEQTDAGERLAELTATPAVS